MRVEKAKVPLAELRVILGKTQPEMAELIGVSLPAIQSIETKRMRVSERLARRASFETSANYEWLKRPHKSKNHPAIDRVGRPYTMETFSKHRARISHKPSQDNMAGEILFDVSRAASILAGILSEPRDVEAYCLVRFEMLSALAELEKRFGANQNLQSKLMEGPNTESVFLRPILSESTIKTIKDTLK